MPNQTLELGSPNAAPASADPGARTRRLGSMVWEEMLRHAIVPTPRAYDVWFTYRAGSSPGLTQCLTRLLDRGKPLTLAVIDGLHAEFVATADLNIEVINDDAGDIEAVAQTLAAQLAGSQAAMQGYGDTLAHWAEHLGDDSTIHGLLKAVASLTSETARAAERNRELEQQLSTSSARIFKLRQSLADVKQEATTDALTGIANRKAFESKLKRAVMQARHDPAAVTSVLLLDVDHFKHFNDTYGHRTGDLVLRLVARLLADNVKGRDTVARYGGEEFAIHLAGADMRAAAVVGRQICEALSGKHLVHRTTQRTAGNVTISVGVAQYRSGETTATLVERADAALYRAKDLGRNRVCTEQDLVR